MDIHYNGLSLIHIIYIVNKYAYSKLIRLQLTTKRLGGTLA